MAVCCSRRRKRGRFLNAASMPEEAPRKEEVNAMASPLAASREGLSWNLAQHFHAGQASGHFAQGQHGGLVVVVDARFVALRQLARAVGGGQGQVKAIGDFVETVFNSNACHGDSLQVKK
jgi:hypothetical protein